MAEMKAMPTMNTAADMKSVFQSYCASGSSEIDGRSFSKLCKDVGLIDRKFSGTDADLVFTKAAQKGQRRLSFADFEVALVLLAERSGRKEQEVFEIVRDAGGPSLKGTKAEAVRFHDDKGTYTGTHACGGPDAVPKGRGHLPGSGLPWPTLLTQEERNSDRKKMERPSSATRGGRFAVRPSIENKAKLLMPPSSDAVRSTKRPSRSPSEVSLPSCESLSRSGSRASSPCPASPSQASAAITGHLPPLSPLGLNRGLLEEAFDSYCGPAARSGMDGKSFAKLCRDSHLIDSSFSATDADLVFSKAAGKGQRRIGFQQFKSALIMVANKKGVDAGDIFCAASKQGASGPQLNSVTKVDAVRFHDDKNTYTGCHVNGGPESVAIGRGTSTQLASASMRYS
eukprot:TRINITY_DN31751_c0_g1_i1.p1 TRINITY_DN31751_c0_g1~~TRINITY_DN31751_c0_g1_i1.p1  ORF type:complete len:398 (+),score=71.08 TRINITY_DN31751_c0_g1_i1:95-1288(+)